MTRLILFWMVCSMLALASFGVLIFEDRHLDIPLPYSVPLAFGAVAVLAPAILMLVNARPARRPVSLDIAAAQRTPAAHRPARVTQGVVLLDLSGTGLKGKAM